jgi:hypothetical protein
MQYFEKVVEGSRRKKDRHQREPFNASVGSSSHERWK